MNELFKLDQTTADGYASYNFQKGETSSRFRDLRRSCCSIVMNSLSNFANITLSSLYFDITKDCLYANDKQRRAVVTTLARVSDLQ
jgi:isoleucyl-tRNA synthetase